MLCTYSTYNTNLICKLVSFQDYTAGYTDNSRISNLKKDDDKYVSVIKNLMEKM